MPATFSVLQGCCVSRFIDVNGETQEEQLRGVIKASFGVETTHCVIHIFDGHPFVDRFLKCKDLHVTTVAKGEYIIQGEGKYFYEIAFEDYINKLNAFLAKDGRRKGEFKVGDKVLLPNHSGYGICTVYGLSKTAPFNFEGRMVKGAFIEYGDGPYKGRRSDLYGSGWSPSQLELVIPTDTTANEG